MTLYILRHAEAESMVASDASRRLTSHGEDQAMRVGRFCQKHSLLPELILTSPVCRAHETALLVNREFTTPSELIEVPWAACGMAPEMAFQEMKAYSAFSSLMLVGHEPDLGELIASLLGLKGSEALHITKASLTIIQCQISGPGRGVLKVFFPCKYSD